MHEKSLLPTTGLADVLQLIGCVKSEMSVDDSPNADSTATPDPAVKASSPELANHAEIYNRRCRSEGLCS